MNYKRKRPKTASLFLVVTILSGGLIRQDAAFAAPPAAAEQRGSSVVSTTDLQPGCQTLPARGAGIDGDGFTLFNWNIKKGTEENWDSDLMNLGGDADLVLIQEATDKMSEPRFVEAGEHWSFSEGYSSGAVVSGVATISAVQPIEQCRLLSIEPWLRTPKATMATRFEIEDSAQTLLVINTHMVNFILGHSAFRRQLADVETLLEDHNGPVIFCGDFNTWRPARYEILLGMTARIGLIPIAFPQDRRAKFFGSPVDHVFVGGLAVEEAKIYEVSSSDHNPMSLRFAL